MWSDTARWRKKAITLQRMHIAIKWNDVDPTQEGQEQQKNIYAEQKYEIMYQSQYIFYFLSSFGRFVLIPSQNSWIGSYMALPYLFALWKHH